MSQCVIDPFKGNFRPKKMTPLMGSENRQRWGAAATTTMSSLQCNATLGTQLIKIKGMRVAEGGGGWGSDGEGVSATASADVGAVTVTSATSVWAIFSRFVAGKRKRAQGDGAKSRSRSRRTFESGFHMPHGKRKKKRHSSSTLSRFRFPPPSFSHSLSLSQLMPLIRCN